jgi:hypothetical protein
LSMSRCSRGCKKQLFKKYILFTDLISDVNVALCYQQQALGRFQHFIT